MGAYLSWISFLKLALIGAKARCFFDFECYCLR